MCFLVEKEGENEGSYWLVLGLVSLVVLGGRVVGYHQVCSRRCEGLFELLGLRGKNSVVLSLFACEIRLKNGVWEVVRKKGGGT